MDDPIVMLGKERVHPLVVPEPVLRIQPGRPVDTSAERTDLVVVGACDRTVRQEVHLDHVPVDVTVVVHEERLEARAVHHVDDLEDANGRGHELPARTEHRAKDGNPC